MPIEFRCSQCGKLLRTGDDTAGKQAKCPACGAIVNVPRPAVPPPPSGQSPFGPAPSSPPVPGSPFAAGPAADYPV
ncbi:MAG: hypothetical protein NTW96_15665, partial [Planctomycetia bacterium]|nr:hypothetical protein [Planctomycetia bacterium]